MIAAVCWERLGVGRCAVKNGFSWKRIVRASVSQASPCMIVGEIFRSSESAAAFHEKLRGSGMFGSTLYPRK